MAIGNLGRTDVKRSLSLLIYLTDDDWNPAADGGALRVSRLEIAGFAY